VDLFAQVLVNGILLGGLYAVMALGLALVWGVLNIVNLAHGAFIMLGAYASWHLYTYGHIDPFLGLPITAAAMFAFGYALQRGVLNLVVRGPMFNTLLITFGLEVVLTYLAQLAFSADFRTINPPYAGNSLNWGTANFSVVLPVARLAAFAVAIALSIGMWLFLLHTRAGRAIRATAQNLVAARLYGVEPSHLYALTFALGAALAGAAGGLYGTVSQINPYVGASLTAKSFAVSIIGGLDNPLGVIVGGLFLGIVESMATLYIGPTFADVASFGILVLVLIVRPGGLLGRTA
jgi:branched-chain amino acid transport system permease protein